MCCVRVEFDRSCVFDYTGAAVCVCVWGMVKVGSVSNTSYSLHSRPNSSSAPVERAFYLCKSRRPEQAEVVEEII